MRDTLAMARSVGLSRKKKVKSQSFRAIANAAQMPSARHRDDGDDATPLDLDLHIRASEESYETFRASLPGATGGASAAASAIRDARAGRAGHDDDDSTTASLRASSSMPPAASPGGDAARRRGERSTREELLALEREIDAHEAAIAARERALEDLQASARRSDAFEDDRVKLRAFGRALEAYVASPNADGGDLADAEAALDALEAAAAPLSNAILSDAVRRSAGGGGGGGRAAAGAPEFDPADAADDHSDSSDYDDDDDADDEESDAARAALRAAVTEEKEEKRRRRDERASLLSNAAGGKITSYGSVGGGGKDGGFGQEQNVGQNTRTATATATATATDDGWTDWRGDESADVVSPFTLDPRFTLDRGDDRRETRPLSHKLSDILSDGTGTGRRFFDAREGTPERWDGGSQSEDDAMCAREVGRASSAMLRRARNQASASGSPDVGEGDRSTTTTTTTTTAATTTSTASGELRKIKCGKCAATLKIASNVPVFRCPKCSAKLRVPGAAATAAAPTAAKREGPGFSPEMRATVSGVDGVSSFGWGSRPSATTAAARLASAEAATINAAAAREKERRDRRRRAADADAQSAGGGERFESGADVIAKHMAEAKALRETEARAERAKAAAESAAADARAAARAELERHLEFSMSLEDVVDELARAHADAANAAERALNAAYASVAVGSSKL